MTYAHREDIYDADTHMMEHPNWIYDFASEDIKDHLEPIVEGDKEVFERIDTAIANFEKRQSSSVQAARVSRVLEIATDNEMKKVEKNFTFLATVGSTAPFIGLFGTVWGIMNSFQSIAISRNTSLAIVAPGIAEALFATALGLLAAIPAVVAYNKFNNDSQKYFSRIENFSKRFLSII